MVETHTGIFSTVQSAVSSLSRTLYFRFGLLCTDGDDDILMLFIQGKQLPIPSMLLWSGAVMDYLATVTVLGCLGRHMQCVLFN